MKNHAHEDCDRVKTRRHIARKCGSCFQCLFEGHMASNCSFKSKCKICNDTHHVALCDVSPKEEDKHEKIPKTENEFNPVPENANVHVVSPSSNLHVGTGSLVVLQTGRGILRGERGGVLFDAGSHRSNVSSKAAGLVNTKGLRRELQGINMFGQKCTNAEQKEVVELKLEPVNGNKVISLEAFVVPEICSIQNSHVELARKE